MKKLVAILAVSLLTVSAFAQNFERSSFLDNWSIGVNGGVAAKTTGADWGDNLVPNFGLRVAKGITPAFGLAVDANFYTSIKPYESIGTVFEASNISALGTLNLMNVFGGYLGEPRLFEITALYGVGWMHTYGHSELSSRSTAGAMGRVNKISSKIGVDFAFNFGSQKQFQVYLEPSLNYAFLGGDTYTAPVEYGYNAVSNGAQPAYNIDNSVAQLNIGFVYKFKNSNGTHNFKYSDKKYTQADVDALQAEIDALKGRQPETITKEIVSDPITKEINVSDLVFVTFAQGSSWIGSEAKEALNSIPEGRHVQIVGTASPEGDADLNQKLSEDRANKVADYLKERGVIVDSAQGLGVQSSTSNRLAIVYVK